MSTKEQIFSNSKHFSYYKNTKLSEHFSYEEFACKGTGRVYVDKDLIIRLEALREAMGGHPIIITSGYRSPQHNKSLPNSAKNSLHQFGKAVDISCHNIDGNKLAIEAKKLGFSEIIKYTKYTDNFVHIAVGKEENPYFDIEEMFPISENRFDIKSPKKLTLEKNEVVIGGGLISIIGLSHGDELTDNVLKLKDNFLNFDGIEYLIGNIELTHLIIVIMSGYFIYSNFKDKIKKWLGK